MDKKVAYNVFRKCFANYIGRTMKYWNKVVFAVKKYKDLMIYNEENKIPKDHPAENISSVKKVIIDQKVKLHVRRKEEIKGNICKMYDKI